MPRRLKPADHPAEAVRPRCPNPAGHAGAVDVAIAGGGVIGLSIAWRLAARGKSVAVLEKDTAGSGASLAASGMLAAAAEFESGGDQLVPLALESQRLWPRFRAELETASGMAIDYREGGTLLVALSRDELERLRFRLEQQKRAGLPSQWLSGPDTRQMEPGLSPSISGGIFCPQDHQVDPPLVIRALCRAIVAKGGCLMEGVEVEGLEFTGGRVSGLRTARGAIRAGVVVVATGAWSGGELLPLSLRLPIRPLKGQSLALRMTGHRELSQVVWTEHVHLAPKSDGRLIIGATVEERGFEDAITAGGVYAVLEGARRALPSIEELEIDAIWSGWRPTSDDDAPILGQTPVEGLLIAAGHHRNGYLLAPVTAHALEELIIGGEMPPVARGFGLARFAPSDQVSIEEGAL